MTSEVANPDKAVLESVNFTDLGAMSDDVSLPADFSQRARDFANTVTKNARTPYDKAIALMNVFHAPPFNYDTRVNLGTTADALDKFLFTTHKGFCEQYAAAFAELARSIGLPTRVAVGYQPGTQSADGKWHVEEKDAHAWPEVWLGPTVGWYRFEPTPNRVDPVTGLGDKNAGTVGGSTTTTTAPKDQTPTTTSAAATPTTGLGQPLTAPPSSPTKSTGTRAHVVTVVIVALALAVGAVAAVLCALAYAAWIRTRRRRHDPDSRRRAGRVVGSARTTRGRGYRATAVDHLARVRAAPGPGTRRGRGRSAAHGPRATAHRRDVLARRPDRGRSRRGLVGGRCRSRGRCG